MCFCDWNVLVLAMLWFVSPASPLPARQEAFSVVTSLRAILKLGGRSIVWIQLVWIDTSTSNDISSFLVVSTTVWTVVPWFATTSTDHWLKHHWWGITSYHSCHATGGGFILASPQMPLFTVVLTRSQALKRGFKNQKHITQIMLEINHMLATISINMA